MVCIGLGVNGETSFFGEAFQTASSGFHKAEFGGVPGGAEVEGDSS